MDYIVRIVNLGDQFVLRIFDLRISHQPLWSSLHDTEKDAYDAVPKAKEVLGKHAGVANKKYNLTGGENGRSQTEAD